MNKQNLKKLLLKNHNRFLKIYKEFNNIDLNDYFGEIAKSKGFKTNSWHDKITFKIDDLDFYNDIDKILLENNILNKKTIEAIKEEFDENRINSSFNHCDDYIYDDIGAGVKGFDDLFYYDKMDYKTGKKTTVKDGWCFDSDSYSSWVELDINANDKLTMLDSWSRGSGLDIAYNANKKGLRVYFEWGRTLEEAVNFQFEILKATIEEINLFKREFKKRLQAMQEAVNDLNDSLKNAHKQQLELDILDYIEENSLIIEGDIEKIKFDYIAKIEDGQAITNKGAIVPIDDAKRVLNKFLEGLDIVNEKIGAFTVNKVFDIKNIIFLRIGCHLIKIDNEIKQQLN